jgi:hypothetical protein
MLTACAGIAYIIIVCTSLTSQLKMEPTLMSIHFQNLHMIIIQEKRTASQLALS